MPIRQIVLSAEWSDCLSRLREARALVLRDAESFHEAAMVLERVGQVLGGEVRNGLGHYKDELVELAGSAEGAQADKVLRLFNTVKEARNMAVHTGAWARHLNGRLVDLFLLLEQAIINKMQCAEDLMVRHPVVAETWHLLGHIRQTLLANSFTTLPVLRDNRWHIISDFMIMRLLRTAPDPKTRKAYLSSTLGSLIDARKIAPIKAKCFVPETELTNLVARMGAGPALITSRKRNRQQLLGILTSFDLL